MDALKESLKGTHTAAVKSKQEELEKAFYEVSTKLYQQAAQAQQAAQGQAGAQPGAQGAAPEADPNVVDADFKEVNDDENNK